MGAIIVSTAGTAGESAEKCHEMKPHIKVPSPMALTTGLDAVQQGVATATQARTAIAAMLRNLDESVANTVYTALRAWVWKALDGRRRDAELREWYALLESVEGRLGARFREHANRIQVLYQLISESITVAETISAEQVLERDHVRAILRILAEAPDGTAERTAIRARLGLKQANLTRVLTLMALAGLIERQPEGRTALFRLTASGATAAAKLPPATVRTPPRPTLPERQEDRGRLIRRMLPETSAGSTPPVTHDPKVRTAEKPLPSLPFLMSLGAPVTSSSYANG